MRDVYIQAHNNVTRRDSDAGILRARSAGIRATVEVCIVVLCVTWALIRLGPQEKGIITSADTVPELDGILDKMIIGTAQKVGVAFETMMRVHAKQQTKVLPSKQKTASRD